MEKNQLVVTETMEAQAQAQVAHVEHGVIQPINAAPASLGSQTLTLLVQNGTVDIMSQRSFGAQWRRSITIHAENLDTFIKAMQQVQKSLRGGKLAGSVTIRDGAVLK